MPLTSALYTGVTGLDANTTRLNVVGNNIANVNTVAFKSSAAIFKPQFYVTDSSGSGPTTNFGGTNPSQRGLGVQVAAIAKDFSPGSIQTTGKGTDMALEGAGFFVVKGPVETYTRDGSFQLDSSNQLVTSAGSFVQGFGVDANNNIIPGKLQNIKIPLGASSAAKATTSMNFTGNFNAAGPVSSGASILTSQVLTRVGGGATPTGNTLLTDVADASAAGTALFTIGQTFTLAGTKGGRDTSPTTFKIAATSTLNDLTSFFQGGLAIATTGLPNPALPTPGVTIEGDSLNPNGARIVIAGNGGKDNSLVLGASAFVSAGSSPFSFQDGGNAAGFTSNPSGESIHTTGIVYDSLGIPLAINITADLQSTSSAGTVWNFTADSGDSKDPTGNQIVGSGTLSFDNNGKLIKTTGATINIDRTGTGSRTPDSVKLDFSDMTALASNTSKMVMAKQDGTPLGTLASFQIGNDGIIAGSFTNGLTRTLGQIAIANFNNPQGLEDQGSNDFSASSNSGSPIVGTAGQFGAGLIRSGSLEQSNVDLSKEFVNMIVASTGFSGASKVITTSNQLLTELLNSAR